ncbi:unnamed protein product, partial [marine sediment metagenome]
MIIRNLLRTVAILVALVPVLSMSCGDAVPKSKNYSSSPPMTIDTSKQYTATIQTTKGDLLLELFAADVPVTVNNFVFLAREGFYNG